MSVRLLSLLAATLCVLGAGAWAAGPEARQEFDQYGGWTRLWVPPTGYFHIKVVQGRLWLVDPLGNAFLWRGVSRLPATKAPDEAVADIKSLGFNGAGPFASLLPGRSGIAYLAFLDIAGAYSRITGEKAGQFPDVFDPAFERAADEAARLQCGGRANDPWLVAHVTDAGLAWERALSDYWRLPFLSPSKQALAKMLKERYQGQPEKFRAAWKIEVGDFDSLLKLDRLEPGPGSDKELVEGDREALVSAVAERYFEVSVGAIRRYDANHMIFGPQFAGRVPREVALVMPGRCSAIWLKPQMARIPAHLISQLYRDTGLAVLLAEPDEGQEAEKLQGFVATAARLPYVIGYAWPVEWSASEAGITQSSAGELPGVNSGYFRSAARAYIPAGARTQVPRYDVHQALRPPTTDGYLNDWGGADWLPLQVSPYVSEESPLDASVALMWDQGHIYISGRVIDRRRQGKTLTAFVGEDTIELIAANRRYLATLRPGHQVVSRLDRPEETTPTPVSVRPIEENGELVGYTFETGVSVPVLVGPGFIVRSGLRFHARAAGKGESTVVSFPADLIPEREKTYGEFALEGPKQGRE